MPHVASIGTYRPRWETPDAGTVGDGRACPQRHLSHVDVSEVHDFFTGNETISYEDVGFAEGVRGLLDRRSRGHDYLQGGLGGARIGLAHNMIPAAVTALTTLEGAT